MTDSGFIGVVDLTVTLSSMNPLGHINIKQANSVFETIVISACKHVYDISPRGKSIGSRSPLLKQGIVREGPAAKFFHFDNIDDLLEFSIKLRSLLLDKGLPFKLCLRTGTLGSGSLRERWQPIVDKAFPKSSARHDDAERTEASKKLLAEFNAESKAEIEDIFKLYLAPGFHGDAVNLSMDFESFKGFGIYIDSSTFSGKQIDERFFSNFFPIKAGGRSFRAVEYVDILFPKDPDEKITRFTRRTNESPPPSDSDEPDGDLDTKDDIFDDVPDTANKLRAENTLELMTRSFKANEDSGSYYVTMLTNIVRSSYFDDMQILRSAEPIPSGNKIRAKGWQNDPPIFSMLMSPKNRLMLRRVGGIELVLGALIDEIADVRIGPALNTYNALDASDPRRKAEFSLADDEVFNKAITRVGSGYGESLLRKILICPIAILNEERKRAVLAVISRS